MVRNFIVGAFEAFAWFFLIAFIAYATYMGWFMAEHGMFQPLRLSPQPWQGAVIGFVVGAIGGIVGTGLIFTLLDIRAGTDRIAWLLENELRRQGRLDDDGPDVVIEGGRAYDRESD